MISPREHIKKLGQGPRKRFGQHFLVHDHSVEKILRFAAFQPGDHVLEVGPGLGALTVPLADIVEKLWAVEIDTDLVSVLKNEIIPPHASHVQIIPADVLGVDFQRLVESGGIPLKVIGNLPYNISTPFLFKLLENSHLVDSAVVMLQAEVANRLMANTGTKDYGILAVLFQYKAEVKKGFYLKPQEFFPVPKVGSIVVLINFKGKMGSLELSPDEEKNFVRIVKVTFGQRRKMLRKSLLNIDPHLKGVLPIILDDCGISPLSRPEELTVEDFLKLSKALWERNLHRNTQQ